MPDLVWAAPFAALLGCIAVMPLAQKHFWEKNYQWVTLALALVTAGYYAGLRHDFLPIVHSAHEYFSFICLIGSLYVVSGGIHIRVKGEATPAVNCAFLAVGAVLANFLGTTGASMVLVRPWIRMNKYRITAFHVIFFIFIVSNVGGGLTPIGDPPLFLGYLRGVPFFWVMQSVGHIWLITVAVLLGIFYVMDQANFKKAPKAVRAKETAHEEWTFDGAQNVLFLLAIIGSVFIQNPPFVREAIMITAAVLSYKTTAKPVHESNDFNFGPIREVAILFAGIFVTMVPALEWLEHHAVDLGVNTPSQFYWGSGILSSVLDNAPTYLNFLAAAIGLFFDPATAAHEHPVLSLLQTHPEYIKAISVGSVYFGAMTYIGNGPNFLVKSIADQSSVKTPSFFGYVFRFSLPILLPVFALVWFIFFR